VTSLPAKGITVYARLYSLINGMVQYNDYTYTEQSRTLALTPLSEWALSGLEQSAGIECTEGYFHHSWRHAGKRGEDFCEAQ
jgi:roadblock/LC7 domain-containing protein